VSTCASCDLETVPHTEFCLACGNDAADGARRGRRFVATASSVDGGADGSARARLLVALLDSDPAALAWLLDHGGLEIEASVTTTQGELLERTLTAAGLQVTASEPTLAEAQRSFRWAGDRVDTAKIVATLSVGALAAALGVPLVAPAAAVTTVILATRRARTVTHRLALRPGVIERSLGIDPAMLSEAHLAMKRLSDPLVVQTLRACVEHVADIVDALHADGASLAFPEVGRLDLSVRDLLRLTTRFALAVDRLGGSADDPTPVVVDPAVKDEIDGQLVNVERALGRLRADVQEVRAPGARDRAIATAKRALVELRSMLDAGLELAASSAGRRVA
jgi:hypothetical protein